jgi:hypothetical protein
MCLRSFELAPLELIHIYLSPLPSTIAFSHKFSHRQSKRQLITCLTPPYMEEVTKL